MIYFIVCTLCKKINFFTYTVLGSSVTANVKVEPVLFKMLLCYIHIDIYIVVGLIHQRASFIGCEYEYSFIL
jgi:hypothetical protein